jgi:hypothetical protein
MDLLILKKIYYANSIIYGFIKALFILLSLYFQIFSKTVSAIIGKKSS